MDNNAVNQPKKFREGKTILLIEDEIPINELYKMVLTEAGYQVITAFNGLSGLEKAQVRVDLVLLDIMLPLMNGIEVLSRIKGNDKTKSQVVVLLTNLGQADVVQKAYQLGAQGYLLKMSLSPEDLINYVDQFIINPQYKMDYNKLILD